MKSEKEFQNEIAKEILRIMQLDNNKENYQKFTKAIEGLKAKDCKVKIGWRAGDEISFTLGYEKGGTKTPFELFFENIEEKAETHGFICGLNPDNFHFNEKIVVNDNHYLIIKFKLTRNEK